MLERDGSVWKDENYDRIVRDFDELARYRSYIARNPAKAQLRACEFVLDARLACLQDRL